MVNFLQIFLLNLPLVLGLLEEKAEAYYEGTKQGEANAQVDGVTGVVETVEATVDAIKNLDQTIAGIQDVIANPEKAFDKIAMSVEEWNKQLTLALETDPKLAGEMMGYLQGQGKFLPNAATSTVVLTGPIAVKLANLFKERKQPHTSLGIDKHSLDKVEDVDYQKFGQYRPDRALPRDPHGNPIPDVIAPHTQIGTKKGRKETYTQAREWDFNSEGKLVPKRDIDFTDHGRPQNHSNPHQHDYIPNDTGGTLKRGGEKPLEVPK